MLVVKRNNLECEYNWEKPYKALQKAFLASNEEFPDIHFKKWCKEHIPALFSDLKVVNVEDIQDVLEKHLMKDFPTVAKSFIIYRYKQAELRAEENFIDQRLSYMDTYENSKDNAAEASETDPNANMSIKNAVSLEAEVFKSKNRDIQRRRMKKQLTKMFSKEVGEQYIKDLEHHIIYAHDEASSPVKKSYCAAVSLYPLLQNGTAPLDGLKGETAPKNLDSFVGQFCNLVFLLSAQVKGAVAYGEFYNILDYYIRKEYGEDYYTKLDTFVESDNMLRRRTILQHIDQIFQHITYYINQPAQNRGNQSPY